MRFLVGCVLVVCACARGGDRGANADELSRFATDSLISGRVIENVTACTVDATCLLRIQFADTSLAVVYGHGERGRAPCEISKAVSDAAFRLASGTVIDVVISRCGSEGYAPHRLESR